MRAKPFSRPTLIAAVELLEGHTQARFNQMVLRLGLENEIDSGGLSVAKTPFEVKSAPMTIDLSRFREAR
jgi:hypothetical protein